MQGKCPQLSNIFPYGLLLCPQSQKNEQVWVGLAIKRSGSNQMMFLIVNPSRKENRGQFSVHIRILNYTLLINHHKNKFETIMWLVTAKIMNITGLYVVVGLVYRGMKWNFILAISFKIHIEISYQIRNILGAIVIVYRGVGALCIFISRYFLMWYKHKLL